MFLVLETFENMWTVKLGNIVSTTKMFLSLLGNIFGSREANFVSATMFSKVPGKQENIDRQRNVSATIVCSALWACLLWDLSFYITNNL